MESILAGSEITVQARHQNLVDTSVIIQVLHMAVLKRVSIASVSFLVG
jgi:hypothetical protein